MKSKIVILGAALLALSAGGVYAAVDAKSVIEARINNFKSLGRANKAMSEELKKPTPDFSVIAASSKSIKDLAPQLTTWFAAGTGPESGVKTEAKAEIWSKPADFKQKAQAFQSRAEALDAAVATKDTAKVLAAQGALKESCRSCHDGFKAKD